MATKAVKDRAGTHLDHRFTKTIKIDGRSCGKLDESKGLYQFGGRRSTFVLWKFKVLGLGQAEWEIVLTEGADSIEFIESERNECWRISLPDAQLYGYSYNIGHGEKFGIPIDRFEVIDAVGNVIRTPHGSTDPVVRD